MFVKVNSTDLCFFVTKLKFRNTNLYLFKYEHGDVFLKIRNVKNHRGNISIIYLCYFVVVISL